MVKGYQISCAIEHANRSDRDALIRAASCCKDYVHEVPVVLFLTETEELTTFDNDDIHNNWSLSGCFMEEA